MILAFEPERFLDSLKYMGQGMAGIIIVILIIIGITALLNKLTNKK